MTRSPTSTFGPPPRQQLVGAERLGDVVVGAGVERANLLALVAHGGEDQDRQPAPSPDLIAYLDALPIREHQVQHQRVGWSGCEQCQRLALALRCLDRVAGIAQDDLEPAHDLGLVVDDEDTRAAHGAAAGCGLSGKLTANEVPRPAPV